MKGNAPCHTEKGGGETEEAVSRDGLLREGTGASDAGGDLLLAGGLFHEVGMREEEERTAPRLLPRKQVSCDPPEARHGRDRSWGERGQSAQVSYFLCA